MKSVALVAAMLLWSTSAALACTAEGVLFYDSDPTVSIHVVPDDLPLGDTRGITVTGAYTGTELRNGGGGLPVGFFIRNGEVINRNGSRMDGVLLIDGDGARITRRDAIGIDSAEGRLAFAEQATGKEISLLQSHLLISGGELDIHPIDGAPRFTRRVLFQSQGGLGIWQSPQPLTLYAAAVAVQRACAPDMAMNLDMGSFDYCTSDGRFCGLLRETDRLSNLLRLER